MNYDIKNFLWEATDGRVYSSAAGSLIAKTAQAYKTWTKLFGPPGTWPRDANGNETDAALQEVLSQHGLFIDLIVYAAAKRYAVETGGIVINEMRVMTDRASQALITGAYNYVRENPDALVKFKTAGGFVELTATQMTAIANAVGAHVQASFAAEGAVNVAIADGTIKTVADVDAASWPANGLPAT